MRDFTTIPIESVLVENNPKHTNWLKNKILKAHLLPKECAICHIAEWLGNPLSLQLDHINGVRDDNRLENLRLLCPNCHSQTDTFAGKNIKTNRRDKRYCADCKKPINKNSIRCRTCHGKQPTARKYKINWPDIESLIAMVNETSYLQVAKNLGVSNTAVKSHIISHS